MSSATAEIASEKTHDTRGRWSKILAGKFLIISIVAHLLFAGVAAYVVVQRYQANRKLWLDLNSFYNVYDHLSTIEKGATFFETEPAPAHLVLARRE